MSRAWLFALLLLAISMASGAQEPAAPASVDSGVSLEQAYKREYAFLVAQKRELEQALAETRSRFTTDRARLDAELASLEASLVRARADGEQLAAQAAEAEQAQLANADNRDLVQATLEQAGTTLRELDAALPGEAAMADADDVTRLAAVFTSARRTVHALATLRQEPGRFHLLDGSETEGTLLHWGRVASWGVAGDAAGVLVPAGGGRYRLWHVDAADAARALAAGRPVERLPVFLYENANAAIADPEPGALLDEVDKGGLIGWIIVALGALGLLLAVLRAVFLKRASASIHNIMDGVAPHVRNGRADDAIAAAKQHKGSAARVVTAALRNLDRDREHLEDIVSEAILHESVHLNRFGALITVIAAVAPLLGLLGTVTGMIQTFDVITEFGTSDPKLLSGGIAIALVTTELGLIVAIPMILIGALLNGWADRIKDGMEGAALKAINLFQDVRPRPAASHTKAA